MGVIEDSGAKPSSPDILTDLVNEAGPNESPGETFLRVARQVLDDDIRAVHASLLQHQADTSAALEEHREAVLRLAAAAPAGRSGKTRLTADLPNQDAEALQELAAATGFNKVTTLVRAIRVLKELFAAEAAGGKLTITYPDGERERLILR